MLDKIKHLSSQVVKKAKEINENAKEQAALNASERSISLKKMMFNSPLYIRRDREGLYYFDNKYNEESKRYEFDGYEWQGAKFETTTKSNTEKKGRAGSALVGGLLAGPAGAVIGGSRGKKSKTKSAAKEREIETSGTLHFYDRENQRYIQHAINVDTHTDSKIRSFFGV